MRENVFTSEDVRAFAKRLRALREGNGMSQEQLAERLDVSRQVVTKWENGSGVPKIDNLIALADCFHISIDELMGRRVSAKDGKKVSGGSKLKDSRSVPGGSTTEDDGRLSGGSDPEDEYRKTIEELQDYSRKTVSLIDRAIRLGSRGNTDSE